MHKKHQVQKLKEQTEREIKVRFYMCCFNVNLMNKNMVSRMLLYDILRYNVRQCMGYEDQDADEESWLL